LTPENEATALETVEFLHSLGVRRMGMNAIIRAGRGEEARALPIERLEEVLLSAASRARELGMDFLWYTPTCYRQFHPVETGLGVKACSAASTTLAIEPDGRILPCQSWFEPLGNALTDRLEDAWNEPLAVRIRSREYLPADCRECEELPLCGGGCPLEKSCGAR